MLAYKPIFVARQLGFDQGIPGKSKDISTVNAAIRIFPLMSILYCLSLLASAMGPSPQNIIDIRKHSSMSIRVWCKMILLSTLERIETDENKTMVRRWRWVKPANGAVAARDVTGRPLAIPIPSRTRVLRFKRHHPRRRRRRFIQKGKRKIKEGGVGSGLLLMNRMVLRLRQAI